MKQLFSFISQFVIKQNNALILSGYALALVVSIAYYKETKINKNKQDKYQVIETTIKNDLLKFDNKLGHLKFNYRLHGKLKTIDKPLVFLFLEFCNIHSTMSNLDTYERCFEIPNIEDICDYTTVEVKRLIGNIIKLKSEYGNYNDLLNQCMLTNNVHSQLYNWKMEIHAKLLHRADRMLAVTKYFIPYLDDLNQVLCEHHDIIALYFADFSSLPKVISDMVLQYLIIGQLAQNIALIKKTLDCEIKNNTIENSKNDKLFGNKDQYIVLTFPYSFPNLIRSTLIHLEELEKETKQYAIKGTNCVINDDSIPKILSQLESCY